MSILNDIQPAAKWIAEALATEGYHADFSVASLAEIDRFFNENAPNGKPLPGGLLDENVGERLFALGCYLGEVLRKSAGGRWDANLEKPDDEIGLLLVLSSEMVIFPIQRIMKRFTNGPEDSISAFAYVVLKKYSSTND
jgi:hypothetical protein